MATEESWLRQAQQATPVRDYLAFLVGNEEYGVAIDRLREIIKVRPVTEVPHAPPFVLGVIAVRGVVLPVLDLHRRLRLSSDGMSRSARFLVVRRGEEELFGLLVDEVRQVVRLSDGEIEPPPPMLTSSEADFVSGIGRSRGRMVILLNLDQVLRFDVRRRGRTVAVAIRAAGIAAIAERRRAGEPFPRWHLRARRVLSTSRGRGRAPARAISSSCAPLPSVMSSMRSTSCASRRSSTRCRSRGCPRRRRSSRE